MRKGLLWIAVPILLLIGCKYEADLWDWEKAPKEYKCTKEQMIKVQEESKWCTDHTGYPSSYCYGTAIMRNCTKEEKK